MENKIHNFYHTFLNGQKLHLIVDYSEENIKIINVGDVKIDKENFYEYAVWSAGEFSNIVLPHCSAAQKENLIKKGMGKL